MPNWKALRFLRDHEEITKNGNRLPHWEQEDTCCFITFRLSDSLPNTLLDQWQEERSIWLDLHPKPWSEVVEQDYDQRFSGKIDHWLDQGHGSSILVNPEASRIVSNALKHYDGTRYLIHGSVIMPNHVHVLATLSSQHPLGKTVQSWKSFSSREINTLLKRDPPLWQKDYFDRLIRDEDHFRNVLRYLANHVRKNPSAILYQAPWLED